MVFQMTATKCVFCSSAARRTCGAPDLASTAASTVARVYMGSLCRREAGDRSSDFLTGCKGHINLPLSYDADECRVSAQFLEQDEEEQRRQDSWGDLGS